MSSLTLPHRRPARPGLRAFLQVIRDWSDRKRSRAALARLDAHLLRDIGIDATRAAHEVARPFWSA